MQTLSHHLSCLAEINGMPGCLDLLVNSAQKWQKGPWRQRKCTVITGETGRQAGRARVVQIKKLSRKHKVLLVLQLLFCYSHSIVSLKFPCWGQKGKHTNQSLRFQKEQCRCMHTLDVYVSLVLRKMQRNDLAVLASHIDLGSFSNALVSWFQLG